MKPDRPQSAESTQLDQTLEAGHAAATGMDSVDQPAADEKHDTLGEDVSEVISDRANGADSELRGDPGDGELQSADPERRVGTRGDDGDSLTPEVEKADAAGPTDSPNDLRGSQLRVEECAEPSAAEGAELAVERLRAAAEERRAAVTKLREEVASLAQEISQMREQPALLLDEINKLRQTLADGKAQINARVEPFGVTRLTDEPTAAESLFDAKPAGEEEEDSRRVGESQSDRRGGLFHRRKKP